jgi:carboxyl-terminal processing protease
MVRRSTLAPLLLAAAVAFTALGMWLGGHPGNLPGALRDVFVQPDSALRAQVIDTIERNFYRPVSERRLKDASLTGIVQSLHDPYSQYFTPQETKLFNEQTVGGQFEGVGMEVARDARGLRVSKVFPGSPAAKGGIRPGDEIVTANGQSLAGVPVESATARITGPAGTAVTLGVRSRSTGRTRQLRLTRAKLDVPLVSARLVAGAPKKVGYVELAGFSTDAHGQLRAQVDRLLHAGARGLVLDLRGNGGGLLSEGVAVASIFVDKGLIVSTRGRERPEQRYDAVGGAIDPHIPLVVLVDGGTASAAEIVTGALRDHHRATVVGSTTFGKGVFQEIEPLSNEGELKLTVGSYYLPGGENLAGHGIVPQVRAPDTIGATPDRGLDVAVKAVAAQIR